MPTIETDYLVIGAGAAGMAFADALIAESPAELVLVDKRQRPGGHWNDAYSFVRLHQPSAFYGVNSRILGTDAIDDAGPNAGLYERAMGPEICSYFQQVLDEHLLPSGQVSFFGQCEYLGEEGGEHQFVSLLTDEVTTVSVRRRIVDATYLETPIPSTHTPSFDADADVHLIPVNGLASVGELVSSYTIIGGGKTAMDACCWLLDNGVAADAICWIRPRDAWLLDRAFQQPLDLVARLMEGQSLGLEAATQAESSEDLFARLEACGQLVRLDSAVEPSMYRCATVSTNELDALRQIERVVRQGRVKHIATDRIVLEDGEVKTDSGAVHVDCSAAGLRVAPARPMFEPERITLQQIRTCQPTFNAALVGFVEAMGIEETEKNRLCPPNPYPDAATDWVWATAISQRAELAWQADPELSGWLDRSRLNAARGIRDRMDDPRLREAVTRYLTCVQPAIDKLEAFRA